MAESCAGQGVVESCRESQAVECAAQDVVLGELRESEEERKSLFLEGVSESF